uniref:Uncharacterized protein n=1 Tax=Rhizophora mucronata TaxID=61149 RepID=A0A2P2LCY9_RHIMU
MIKVIQLQSMSQAACQTTRPTNVCTSILFVRKCIKMTNSSNKHLNTNNEVLKLSSFLCIPYESRLCSKKDQHSLENKTKLKQTRGCPCLKPKAPKS